MIRRPGARRRPDHEELPLGVGCALAGLHYTAARVTARIRNDRRSPLPVDGGAVSLPLPVRRLRRGAAYAEGSPGARRHGGGPRRQRRAIPRGGGSLGGAVRALLCARRRDSPGHAGARFSRILPPSDRVTPSPRRRHLSGPWRDNPRGVTPANREGGVMSPLILVHGLRSQYHDGTVALNGVLVSQPVYQNQRRHYATLSI